MARVEAIGDAKGAVRRRRRRWHGFTEFHMVVEVVGAALRQDRNQPSRIGRTSSAANTRPCVVLGVAGCSR